jgi:hypothetical protein
MKGRDAEQREYCPRWSGQEVAPLCVTRRCLPAHHCTLRRPTRAVSNTMLRLEFASGLVTAVSAGSSRGALTCRCVHSHRPLCYTCYKLELIKQPTESIIKQIWVQTDLFHFYMFRPQGPCSRRIILVGNTSGIKQLQCGNLFSVGVFTCTGSMAVCTPGVHF